MLPVRSLPQQRCYRRGNSKVADGGAGQYGYESRVGMCHMCHQSYDRAVMVIQGAEIIHISRSAISGPRSKDGDWSPSRRSQKMTAELLWAQACQSNHAVI